MIIAFNKTPKTNKQMQLRNTATNQTVILEVTKDFCTPSSTNWNPWRSIVTIKWAK